MSKEYAIVELAYMHFAVPIEHFGVIPHLIRVDRSYEGGRYVYRPEKDQRIEVVLIEDFDQPSTPDPIAPADDPIQPAPPDLPAETLALPTDKAPKMTPPNLLESLRGLLSALDEDCRDTMRWDDLMFNARAAIAKATGEKA